jgi:DNA-binding NarL/FixJ family response regulator
MGKRFRILVVDDHEAMRRGVRTLVESVREWEVCGEAANGRDALEKTRELKPDLVLMDLTMPEMNGLEAARQIRKFSGDVKIVVFSMHESAQIRQDSKSAGVDAYVSKSAAGNELVDEMKRLLSDSAGSS